IRSRQAVFDETCNRSRDADVEQSLPRANRRLDANNRAERADQCRGRYEVRQGSVNAVSLGYDEMAELMRQQDAHQRYREGNPQYQVCRVLKKPFQVTQ